MNIFKKKEPNKENAQLENLCNSLDENIWIKKDVEIIVKAEGNCPKQIFEGKLIISRIANDKV